MDARIPRPPPNVVCVHCFAKLWLREGAGWGHFDSSPVYRAAKDLFEVFPTGSKAALGLETRLSFSLTL